MQTLPGINVIGIMQRLKQCWWSTTQYSRNGGPSTPASRIAVGKVQAIVPSNMKIIQNHTRIHCHDHLAGLHLLSFPLSTIS